MSLDIDPSLSVPETNDELTIDGTESEVSAAIYTRELAHAELSLALGLEAKGGTLIDVYEYNRKAGGLVISSIVEYPNGGKSDSLLVIEGQNRGGLPEDAISWFGKRAMIFDGLVERNLESDPSRLNAVARARSYMRDL